MQCTAFSYTRFSTLKQEQGDSGRRQIESARKYAAERSYILDESIGLTAANPPGQVGISAKGLWMNSLKRIESKTIPRGSILIVEKPRSCKPATVLRGVSYLPAHSERRNRNSFPQYSGRFEAGTLLHQYSPGRRRNRPGELRKRAEERKGRGSLVKEAGNVQTAKRP